MAFPETTKLERKATAAGTSTDAALHNNTVYEWILHSTFTVSAREQSVQRLTPFLTTLLRPGDNVLDLCCGSGPMSFWFEKQGANVTGIDFAPYMIAQASDEARRRNSSVNFVEADIFTYDLGRERFNLISCFGNSISDFCLSDLAKLAKPLSQALRPGGRFVLEYHDGSYDHMQGTVARQGVYQDKPERITYSFASYLPRAGAVVTIIQNETRGEAYQRQAYIYTIPMVQFVLARALELERHITMSENHFLDIYFRRH